jgi:hypothetical protein
MTFLPLAAEFFKANGQKDIKKLIGTPKMKINVFFKSVIPSKLQKYYFGNKSGI